MPPEPRAGKLPTPSASSSPVLRHFEAHRVHEKVRDRLWLCAHHLAEHVDLVKHRWDVPLRLLQRLPKPAGHRVARVLVFASHDRERAFLRLVLEHSHAPFELTVRLIQAMPAVLSRVSVDARGRVRRHLAYGFLDLNRQGAQRRHTATHIPMRLSSNFAVAPEAVLARDYHVERRGELFVGDQLTAVLEQRLLFETCQLILAAPP